MGLLLRRAHNRTTGALIAAMRPYGLELRHFAMLIVLADRGPTLQRDLVDATGFDKAAVGRAIDDLQAADLVTRVGVEGDRRVWMVQITERGLEIFDEVHARGAGHRRGLGGASQARRGGADHGPAHPLHLSRTLTSPDRRHHRECAASAPSAAGSLPPLVDQKIQQC